MTITDAVVLLLLTWGCPLRTWAEVATVAPDLVPANAEILTAAFTEGEEEATACPHTRLEGATTPRPLADTEGSLHADRPGDVTMRADGALSDPSPLADQDKLWMLCKCGLDECRVHLCGFEAEDVWYYFHWRWY